MKKYVYFFGKGKADGNAKMKKIIGGKGAGLAEMTNLKVPVPPGFTISTDVCIYFYQHGNTYPKELKGQVGAALMKLEKTLGKKFGDNANPLLVSVRSGAPVSMPGMMDTILNLGMNWDALAGVTKRSGSPRFAHDCFRRFIQMYGGVVMGISHDDFERVLSAVKKKYGAKYDADLAVIGLKEVIDGYLKVIKKVTGKDLPLDPVEQLWGAIHAVFNSWNNPRAKTYRRINKISDALGTAVNIQVMVFGNMGENSATGVAFTRNPATGDKAFFGEFLVNAQGEDVVAGIRTPRPIAELKGIMPKAYKQLNGIRLLLEKHYHDMQDVEFTIEDGTLYMLQTRSGKRTGLAAVRIAVDMATEKLITPKDAIQQVDPELLVHLLAPVFDFKEKEKARKEGRFLASGLNAGPGAAKGRLVFEAAEAVEIAKFGAVILVRTETSPEDLAGMHAAQGILTARGGMTSHAAVVARGMGKPCVVGCGALHIDEGKGTMEVEGKALAKGDWISIDGSTGEVFAGAIDPQPSEIVQVLITKEKTEKEAPVFKYFKKFIGWANRYRTLRIRTNADTPHDSRVARAFGAEGIGLTRTEHMFFAADRILAVRQMIVASTREEREKALAKIEPMQQKDFEGIFEAMKGLPVTIRLLDPPLHEFLPHEPEQIAQVAAEMGVAPEVVAQKVNDLTEMNPMMGHRGCRLVITFPEIAAMQARAIFRAACRVKKAGIKVLPEIMIPLVGMEREFEYLEEIIRPIGEQIMKEEKVKVDYLLGTMIEIPRACVVADKIAVRAEFFSYGTNDLTQMTFGFSRDDYAKFVPDYMLKKILPHEPFQSLDQQGVGELVRMGTQKGRSVRKNLKVGVCGEHGGDPRSIAFFHSCGFNYVSCSPYRVPVAIHAAAYAALTGGKMKGGD
jgi:pyruvate,orthophosphate dikinase